MAKQSIDETDLRRVLRALEAGTRRREIAQLLGMSASHVTAMVDVAALRYWRAAKETDPEARVRKQWHL